jgi:hypothetical protein
MEITPGLEAALVNCLTLFERYEHEQYHGRTEDWEASRPVLHAIEAVYDAYNAARRANHLPPLETGLEP